MPTERYHNTIQLGVPDAKHPQDLTWVSQSYTDGDGHAAGGVDTGVGYCIAWQHGPRGRGPNRRVQTGAMPEDVLNAVIRRLEWLQMGPMHCDENKAALKGLREAKGALLRRERTRTDQGVEGVYIQHEQKANGQ